MIIKELLRVLDGFAPFAYQEDYDNAGLLVGDLNSEITGLLLCLDSTEEVIEEAIDSGCNCVLAHHPIIFGGLKSLTGKNYVERVVIKAIQNNINIIALHTNLDNVKYGVNAKIAEKLKLNDVRVLKPKKQSLVKLITYVPINSKEVLLQAMFDAGAGKIGNYSECSFGVLGEGTFKGNNLSNPSIGEKGVRETEKEIQVEFLIPRYKANYFVDVLKRNHPYEEVAYELVLLENTNQDVGSGMIGKFEKPMEFDSFLKYVKDKMEVSVIRHTPEIGRKIEAVAWCGGSGSFLLAEAKRQGADAFITSDFKYHEFFDAEKSLVIADIGHYESEQFTAEILHAFLKDNFSSFAIRFSEVNTNPIQYYF